MSLASAASAVHTERNANDARAESAATANVKEWIVKQYRIGMKTDATIFDVMIARLRSRGRRERVPFYCVHGTYIGTPGGPDFMCGRCEDGWTCGHGALNIFCATCRRVARRDGLGTAREWYRAFTPIPHVSRFKLLRARWTLMWAVSVNGRRLLWAIGLDGKRPYFAHFGDR